MRDKQTIRREMKALRDTMSAGEVAEKSRAIVQRLLALPAIEAAISFFVYVSFGNEVDTHGLVKTLLEHRKTVSVPCIVGDGEMIAAKIDSFAELKPGRFGILAPPPEPPPEGRRLPHPEIVIMPGVAFTEAGARLGLGGGYFDRYFIEQPQARAIALCYESQLVEQLPVETHDAKADVIVTEVRVIECGDV